MVRCTSIYTFCIESEFIQYIHLPDFHHKCIHRHIAIVFWFNLFILYSCFGCAIAVNEKPLLFVHVACLNFGLLGQHLMYLPFIPIHSYPCV